MPRGVAIPEVRQQLFAAVERVILRDGPARLSGRAITAEAAVATGLLYAHFNDLDDFLVGYVVDRSFTIAANAKSLPGEAGRGDVAQNLSRTLLAVPINGAKALARLVAARPELAAGARSVLGDGNTGIDVVASAVADFLAAEKRLGRVDGAADVVALAEVVAGVFHHLVLAAPDTELPQRLHRGVAAVVDGVTTAAPT